LIMMTSTLAGCTGGDPDGGGNDNIDMDVINSLIDDNLQDFINNTTITVENHYHNNTTIMNDNTDNSISNVNGSSSVSTLKMFTVSWDPSVHTTYEDIGNRVVSMDGNLQQSNNNPYLLLMYIYNGFTIEFENITCNEINSYGNYNIDDDDWRSYINQNYGWNDNQIYGLSDTIDDDFKDLKQNTTVREQCNYFASIATGSQLVDVYSINIQVGEAFELVSTGYVDEIYLDCDDGYSSSLSNNTGIYLGGQANCTITAIAEVQSDSGDWVYSTSNSNGTGNDSSSWPDWGPSGYYWHYYDMSLQSYYTPTPNNFAVYFNIVAVENYL